MSTLREVWREADDIAKLLECLNNKISGLVAVVDGFQERLKGLYAE